MSEALTSLIGVGQQLLQQQGGREEDASVCIVGIAPVLLAAAIVGLSSLRRRLGVANPRAPGQ